MTEDFKKTEPRPDKHGQFGTDNATEALKRLADHPGGCRILKRCPCWTESRTKFR